MLDLVGTDEPTIGLDPVGACEFRQVIRNPESERKTILLTTHYMFEADILCKRVAVINHGKIIALDSPGGLEKEVSDLSVVEFELFGISDELVARLRSDSYIDAVSVEDRDQRQLLLVQSAMGAEAVPRILDVLKGARVGRVSVREPSLEDAYVHLVGGTS
ncbi:MAG TPA: hypothetical protein VMW69_00615 [Spirochaetia bacterium]|nr:hypothetical protein [Spirochaetia bacterium]